MGQMSIVVYWGSGWSKSCCVISNGNFNCHFQGSGHVVIYFNLSCQFQSINKVHYFVHFIHVCYLFHKISKLVNIFLDLFCLSKGSELSSQELLVVDWLEGMCDCQGKDVKV